MAGEDSQDAESQGCGLAGEDSQDAEGQRVAMTVSDVLLSPKSHRQTSVLGTDIHSGTGTEVIQSIQRVTVRSTIHKWIIGRDGHTN
jgi:hypothetical protein